MNLSLYSPPLYTTPTITTAATTTQIHKRSLPTVPEIKAASTPKTPPKASEPLRDTRRPPGDSRPPIASEPPRDRRSPIASKPATASELPRDRESSGDRESLRYRKPLNDNEVFTPNLTTLCHTPLVQLIRKEIEDFTVEKEKLTAELHDKFHLLREYGVSESSSWCMDLELSGIESRLNRVSEELMNLKHQVMETGDEVLRGYELGERARAKLENVRHPGNALLSKFQPLDPHNARKMKEIRNKSNQIDRHVREVNHRVDTELDRMHNDEEWHESLKKFHSDVRNQKQIIRMQTATMQKLVDRMKELGLVPAGWTPTSAEDLPDEFENVLIIQQQQHPMNDFSAILTGDQIVFPVSKEEKKLMVFDTDSPLPNSFDEDVRGLPSPIQSPQSAGPVSLAE